jgi:putative GTP pyrophosphokinase
MTTEALKDLAINFYTTHDQEIEQIKTLLEIKLAQICMSYTSAYNLPKEALTVKARVKTLDSFLKKLKKKGWPVFNNPATIINDLIGARITCWFLDDCTGILRSLIESS